MNAEYICPVLTCFDQKGEIDYEGMHQLYERVIQAGLDGIVILGSSGEFYSLTYAECEAVGRDAVAYIAGRVKLYIGTGRLILQETVALSNEMIKEGASGVIIVPPYYINASDEGFYAYYHQAAQGIRGDILLYNYPDRTGYDISIPVLERLLAEHRNIIGIKDTVESPSHTQKIIKALRPLYPDFKIYSGYDNNFLPVVMAGGNGCIAAISNIEPKLCAAWVRAVREENFTDAAEIHREIVKQMDIYYVSVPFMPAMKRLLIDQGVHMTDVCRLPIVRAEE